MHLDDEQLNRFATAINALYTYTNLKLKIVQPLSPRDQDRSVVERSHLVGRELWRHLELIDSFVRENPFDLAQEDVEMVRRWKAGITCRGVVIDYDEQGNALIECEAGSFVVRGISQEPIVSLGIPPIVSKVTLIPFDDFIVWGAPFESFSHPYVGELAYVRRQAAANGFTGLLSSSDELLERSRIFAQLREAQELQSTTAQASSKRLGAGFHRGKLADLPFEQRVAIAEEQLKEAAHKTAAMKALLDGDTGSDDMDLTEENAVQLEIFRLIEACTYLRGIVPISDVYAQHVILSAQPLSRVSFEQMVSYVMARHGCEFDLWEFDEVRYVVAPLLANHAAFGLAMTQFLQDRKQETTALPAWWESSYDFDAEARHELHELMDQQRAELDEKRLELLELQMREPRPVERRMLDQGILSRYLRLDAVAALRNYLDAHVPDGQDDRYFADALVNELACTLVVGEVGVDRAYKRLARYGMWNCEGSDWSDTLGRLVVNLYNALPRWEQGGWSLRMCKESLTGRHERFMADGSILIEDDD